MIPIARDDVSGEKMKSGKRRTDGGQVHKRREEQDQSLPVVDDIGSVHLKSG